MNTASTFPNEVDGLIFFQDMNLENEMIFKEYQTLLSNQKHTQAAQYLKNSNILYYGADLFNSIENRILALQKHMKSNPRNNSHTFSASEPANAAKDAMWID